jgi:hypothetical protein
VALAGLAGSEPTEADGGVASLAQAAAKRQRRSRRTGLAVAIAAAAALAIVGGVVGATVFPRTNVASYDIVVTTDDGRQTVVGSWKPAGDEATGLSAATSIPTPQIRTVDIRVSGTDQPLAVTTL